MQEKKRGRGRSRWLLPAALVLAGAAWFENFTLSTSTVTAVCAALPEAFSGLRIVQISDLHGRRFDAQSRYLLELVRLQSPDLIALTGDLADEFTDFSMLPPLLEGLTALAPTFYVTGNHEWRMENRKQWFELLSACGVTRLENSFVMLSREGGSVVLAGVDDPNGPADQKTPGQLLQEIHEAAPQAYTIVLCHRNDQLERFARLGADLVLSGHAHGGVVRLPFLGAVFGTHYEFFPDYTAGLYTMGKTTLAVSRGLGGSRRIPIRIANQPEIPVITLRAGETER